MDQPISNRVIVITGAGRGFVRLISQKCAALGARIAYFVLDPDSLTDQVVYAINQPWGVSIADVTVRASGEGLIL